MKDLQKTLLINLGILLGYTVLSKVFDFASGSGQIIYLMMMLLAVGAHTGILIISALIAYQQKDKSTAWANLLCGVVILVIGFSACLGGATLKL